MPNLRSSSATPNYIIVYFVISTILAACGGAIVFNLMRSITYESLGHIVTGLVVGSASLLLVLSSRSSIITERIRRLSEHLMENILTYGPSYESEERREFTKRQLDILRDRFHLSLVSVGCQLLAVLFLVGAVIFSLRTTETVRIDNAFAHTLFQLLSPENEYQQIDVLSALVFAAAGFCFAFGVVSTLIDLWLSKKAISIELSFAIAIPEKYEPRLDSRNTETVIHFNSLFCSIWYEGGLGETLDSKKAKPESIANQRRLIRRYYGIHREEFYFFTLGLLPRAVYGRWLEHLRKQKDHKPLKRGSSIAAEWLVLLENESNLDFKDHMKSVLCDMVAIQEILSRLDN